MAKAREVPLRGDETLAAAASRVVTVRAKEVFEHSGGVLDTTDIERVHAMRVATRRLRAALEVFRAAFPPDRLKPVLRDVKRLADALGARRDPDVHLEDLDELHLDPTPGLRAFIAELHAEQVEGNVVLEAALRETQERDLRGRLAALTEAAG